MQNATLTLVNDNPATNVRRIVNITRNPRVDESKLLETAFAGKGGGKSSLANAQKSTWEESFINREQDLVLKIQEDQQANQGGSTAYAVYSTDTSHAGTALAALTCSKLGVPLIIFQHKYGNQLDSIEVLFKDQRFVASMAGAGETARVTA